MVEQHSSKVLILVRIQKKINIFILFLKFNYFNLINNLNIFKLN